MTPGLPCQKETQKNSACSCSALPVKICCFYIVDLYNGERSEGEGQGEGTIEGGTLTPGSRTVSQSEVNISVQ